MKLFRWAHDKNEQLKAQRNISFEQIVVAVEVDGLLDILEHPSRERYPNQLIFVVVVDGYFYLVPFVEESDCYFLRTIIPSRKATRDYLKRGGPNEKT